MSDKMSIHRNEDGTRDIVIRQVPENTLECIRQCAQKSDMPLADFCLHHILAAVAAFGMDAYPEFKPRKYMHGFTPATVPTAAGEKVKVMRRSTWAKKGRIAKAKPVPKDKKKATPALKERKPLTDKQLTHLARMREAAALRRMAVVPKAPDYAVSPSTSAGASATG